MASFRPTRRHYIVTGVVAFFVVLGAWLIVAHPTSQVDSYAACVAAGYPVQESNPTVCSADGHNFVGPAISPSPHPDAVVNQPFELLVDGDSRGSYARGWQVITSQAAWQAYWRAVHASVSLPPLIPVDFSTSDVVALSDGSKPSGGFRVEVTSIQTSSAGTQVQITDTSPAISCQVTQAVTNPYFIVRTTKLPEPVSFVVTPSVHTCH